MRLLHFALRAEAQAFIEVLNASPYPLNTLPLYAKAFRSDDTVLLIGGIGQEATRTALEAFFKTHRDIDSAFNIGIAGCNDTSVPVGTLFSYLPYRPDSAAPPIKTSVAPATRSDTKQTTLHDMECAAFYDTVQAYVAPERIGVFKIVSDHLSDAVPTKAFVKALMIPHRHHIVQTVELSIVCSTR